MEYEELTGKIINCAFAVYNAMGFGYLESVYERCLVIELEKAGMKVNSQVPIKVTYNNVCVGDFYADILVEDEIVVELKSVTSLAKAHHVQLVNYLTATKKPIGLLINFGPEKVEVKRKFRDLDEIKDREL